MPLALVWAVTVVYIVTCVVLLFHHDNPIAQLLY